jgi:hypothetical protein
MVILCGYTGGYTELGGGEAFLKKIREDVVYKRLTPAIFKRGKFNREQNSQISENDSGITGSALLRRVVERFKKNDYKTQAAALIIFDDTDCKMQDHQQKYRQALKRFIYDIQEVNPTIPIIFFFAEPEIEMWFYYDATNIFKNNVPLIRELNSLYEEYQCVGWQYDPAKEACLTKFSALFVEVLNKHKISYSKKIDGSNYLRKTAPENIAKHDSNVSKAIATLSEINA